MMLTSIFLGLTIVALAISIKNQAALLARVKYLEDQFEKQVYLNNENINKLNASVDPGITDYLPEGPDYNYPVGTPLRERWR